MSPIIQRRHLELIAQLVRQLPPEMRGSVAVSFARSLGTAAEVTLKFDPDRFTDACLGLIPDHSRRS